MDIVLSIYIFLKLFKESQQKIENQFKLFDVSLFFFLNTVPMRCAMNCVTKPVYAVFKNKIKLFVTNNNYFSSDYELLS